MVAQMVKNLPAMQESWVQSLGLKRSCEEGNGNPLQYSCLENSMEFSYVIPWYRKESDMTE